MVKLVTMQFPSFCLWTATIHLPWHLTMIIFIVRFVVHSQCDKCEAVKFLHTLAPTRSFLIIRKIASAALSAHRKPDKLRSLWSVRVWKEAEKCIRHENCYLPFSPPSTLFRLCYKRARCTRAHTVNGELHAIFGVASRYTVAFSLEQVQEYVLRRSWKAERMCARVRTHKIRWRLMHAIYCWQTHGNPIIRVHRGLRERKQLVTIRGIDDCSRFNASEMIELSECYAHYYWARNPIEYAWGWIVSPPFRRHLSFKELANYRNQYKNKITHGQRNRWWWRPRIARNTSGNLWMV